jgi:uncharacterized membrane protein
MRGLGVFGAAFLTHSMAEYYALQAALCFSIAHIFVRRGLFHSNAWVPRNIAGTLSVIAGVVVLSMAKLVSWN